ncbi:MAG TPA: hypothetical protein VJ623_04310 [Holophagaceae bacterium]|nr:hypothetical protein [Holophagaceae bacterium]
MDQRFWIRRFLLAFGGFFLLLTIAAILRGHPGRASVAHGVEWGALTALIFTGSGLYNARRGRACALCAVPRSIRKA